MYSATNVETCYNERLICISACIRCRVVVLWSPDKKTEHVSFVCNKKASIICDKKRLRVDVKESSVDSLVDYVIVEQIIRSKLTTDQEAKLLNEREEKGVKHGTCEHKVLSRHDAKYINKHRPISFTLLTPFLRYHKHTFLPLSVTNFCPSIRSLNTDFIFHTHTSPLFVWQWTNFHLTDDTTSLKTRVCRVIWLCELCGDTSSYVCMSFCSLMSVYQ